MVDHFHAALARVWLYEAVDNSLRLKASAGWSARTEDSRWAILNLAAYPHRLADVARTGRACVLNGLAGEGDVDATWVEHEKIASLAYYPLVVGDELVGVLAYFSRREITPEFADVLSAFVTIATLAINNVQLFAGEQAARLQAEREHERLQTVLNTIPVGVLVAEGPDGGITLLNPAGEQIGGRAARRLTMEQFQAETPLRYTDGRPIPPEERPLWRSLHHRECVHETLCYTRPDGEDIILDVTSAPFPGELRGAISTFQDITQQRRLESELAERAGQLKALLDHLPVGVMYFDSGGICRACNGAARILLGLGRPRTSPTGARSREVFIAAPVLETALNACLLGRIPQHEPSVSWPDPQGDGAARFLDWRFEPLGVEDTTPMGALALVVDVSDRTRAEAELQRAMKAAELSSRNKTRFLSSVSHDLRTPVNAMSLLAEVLAHVVARDTDPDPELAALVSDIQHTASGLVELLNDLLDISRFDSGALEISPSTFGLDDWLATTLRPLELTARTKRLAVEWTVDSPGRVIRGDRIKMGRVLTNLVANAIKFTDRGSVRIDVLRAHDGCLLMTVADTGPGIPVDQRERIFDEFSQLQNPERDRTKGTGLGLAICRRLVDAVGGSLSVESAPGRGSTFTVRYPPDHLLSTTPPTPLTVVPSAPPPSSAAQVLLVEDDEQSRRALAQLLRREGIHVEEVCDGAQALRALDRVHPDIMLLDLLIPELDGLEVVRRVRARPELRDLPVVVISGAVHDTAQLTDLAALNVRDTIPKPVNFETLLALIPQLVKPPRDNSQ
jgi:two-component system sensor histidine kinase EvgS